MKNASLKKEKQKSAIRKKFTSRGIIAFLLFISLILSVIYSLIRFIYAPAELGEGAPYEKIKSDYLLMLTQCLLGIVVMSLPSIITRKLNLIVPNTMCDPDRPLDAASVRLSGFGPEHAVSLVLSVPDPSESPAASDRPGREGELCAEMGRARGRPETGSGPPLG